jgi:sigma-B regulation protein RsbU (phosphoserine phosphatase)
MTTFVDPFVEQRNATSTARILRIQEALTSVRTLGGVSIWLQTTENVIVRVLKDGNAIAITDPASLSDSEVEPRALSLALGDGSTLLIRDVDPQHVTGDLVGALVCATLRLLDCEKREESLLEELGADWESLEALYEISTAASRSGNINDALNRLISRLSVLQTGIKSALFLERAGRFEPVASSDPGVVSLTLPELGRLGEVVQLRQLTVLKGNPRVDSGGPTPWSSATNVAAAPIISAQECLGFVAVWREDTSNEFGSPFLRILEAITYQTSIMMDAERLNRKLRERELLAQELEIASFIQQSLLLANAPKDVPGLEIASCSVPSKHVNGDFHDFFEHADGTLDVLLGDTMGKGVAAALLSAETKSQFLRATAELALRSNTCVPPRPAETVNLAASRLSDRLIGLEHFVTLCYARFDPVNQDLIFVDCGHTSTLVDRKSEPECTFLPGVDLPLGVMPNETCREQFFKCSQGDTFLFYSDGVTDNRSPDGESFGTERLAECLQNWSSLGPALLVEQIRKEAVRFAKSDTFPDDFTCIAVRITATNPDSLPVMSRSTSFSCDCQNIGPFRAWLSESLDVAGECLSEEAKARLELACTELFVNCATHAYLHPTARPVRVESRIFPDYVTIQIRHEGPEFDPLSIPTPVFDGSKESGFGVYVVLRSADEASFKREADGANVTTLSFIRNRKMTL